MRTTISPKASALSSRSPAGRRRRKLDLGAHLARAICAVFALVGALPFLAVILVRSAGARVWAARESQRLLAQQGIVASFVPSLRVWPLALELDRVRLESSDGGAPALQCPRVRVRPKLFALLDGKLAIDEVDLEQPRIRVVLRDGRVSNVAVKSVNAPRAPGPLHVPFNSLSVTDASIDLDAVGARAYISSLDLDVSVEDDAARGSSFEVALRTGKTTIHRSRSRADGSIARDDDALCSMEGRVRVEPGSVFVRRLEGIGAADLDADAGAPPPCNLPASDQRRVEISLGHLRVDLPADQGKPFAFDGHVRARAPIGLAERVAALPETGGWVGVDLDVSYGPGSILPDASGTIEAHGVRLDQYAFAQELRSEITLRKNVITSPKTTIRLADGTIVLTGSLVEPLAAGGKLVRTRLDASDVDFTALMRDL
ncbi:MAG: hypothetical protein ACREJ3_14290, partial [Polyangiaceae bacterium]